MSFGSSKERRKPAETMEQPARPRQQAITSGEVEDDYIQVVIKKNKKNKYRSQATRKRKLTQTGNAGCWRNGKSSALTCRSTKRGQSTTRHDPN